MGRPLRGPAPSGPCARTLLAGLCAWKLSPHRAAVGAAVGELCDFSPPEIWKLGAEKWAKARESWSSETIHRTSQSFNRHRSIVRRFSLVGG